MLVLAYSAKCTEAGKTMYCFYVSKHLAICELSITPKDSVLLILRRMVLMFQYVHFCASSY